MSIPSVFSLIDTLCIFLCGGVIVNVALSKFFLWSYIPIYNDNTEIMIMIFASYLVGLIFHRLVEWLTCCLRRSPKLMFLSLNRYMSGKKGTHQKCKCASFKYGCAFFVCLLFSKRKCPALTGLYDECYTIICKENMIGDIKVLEGQLAFVRNCIFLLPFLLFFCVKLCVCCKVMWFLVSFLVLTRLWENIQMKQFEMVWDYAFYLDENKYNQKYSEILTSVNNLKCCIL